MRDITDNLCTYTAHIQYYVDYNEEWEYWETLATYTWDSLIATPRQWIRAVQIEYAQLEDRLGNCRVRWVRKPKYPRLEDLDDLPF